MSKEMEPKQVFTEVKQLMERSRQQIAVSVNSTLSLLYWEIGRTISTEILQNKRADYGRQLLNG